MTDSERSLVRAMLTAAKVPARDVDWMAASCPSVERCKEFCLQQNKWWRK